MNGGKWNMMRTLVLTAAVLCAVVFFPRVAAAVGTPAGTAISNQATVTYQDVSANSFSAVSNTTTVTVQPVYSLTITTPADQSVPSNTTAYYAYTLTNTGNASNTFALSGLSAPLAWAVTLYADDGAGVGGIANDGFHQAGETNVIASTGAVAADGTYRFFMAVTVPSGTANGANTGTTLTVTGAGGGAEDDTTDSVTTTAQAPALTVAKDVRNVTTGGAFTGAGTANATPTQVLEYQVTVTNGGSVAATSVVLADPINANTGFIVGSASFNAGSSGLTGATIAYSNDSGVTYGYGPPASGGCGAPAGADYCVTNIRWTGTGSMASGGTSFSTLFQVRVK